MFQVWILNLKRGTRRSKRRFTNDAKRTAMLSILRAAPVLIRPMT